MDSTDPYAAAPGAALQRLRRDMDGWAKALGFQQLGVCVPQLQEDAERLAEWLSRGFHGHMTYMSRHGERRTRPEKLVPGTVRVISVRMDYLTESAAPWGVLHDPQRGYISRYALGRDYHKVVRGRLLRLARRIEERVGNFGYRVFTDSAPVMEKPLARSAGLGWIGKHTNLLNRHAGSWFFLGEIYTDLPLPADAPYTEDHCGSCRRCIEICPTRAIVAPYQLDARRCISYLTIELRGPIPVPLRPLIGNRIYGCDDCQLVCPWNRYAQRTGLPDFAVRHGLDAPRLATLLGWSEREFERHTEGMAIRRVGYLGWLRNVAVGLGNAPASPQAKAALEARRGHSSPLVAEHVAWALDHQAQA